MLQMVLCVKCETGFQTGLVHMMSKDIILPCLVHGLMQCMLCSGAVQGSERIEYTSPQTLGAVG